MKSRGSQDELVGSRFGSRGTLVIVRAIGRGGSSSIYLAWDEENQRSVALKVLFRDYSSNPVLLARFEREGQTVGALRHPNLVQVLGHGQDRGHVFIVTEFVPGRNLYQVLQEDGPFGIRRALEVGRCVASGLAEAHRHGIVHRDLKPENIMIRRDDQAVKVLDFGIAKDLNATMDLTGLGMYIGTPAYSSPEQIRGEKVDHRTDIFSLGVILYELLTGKVAFEGRHSTEVLRVTLKEVPAPLTEINRTVTRPVALLVERMIEKEPKARFADMEAVVQEIDRRLLGIRPDWSAEEQGGVRKTLRRMFQP